MGTEPLKKSHDGKPGADMTGAMKNAIMETSPGDNGDAEKARKSQVLDNMAAMANNALGKDGIEAEENKNEVEFEDKQEGT